MRGRTWKDLNDNEKKIVKFAISLMLLSVSVITLINNISDWLNPSPRPVFMQFLLGIISMVLISIVSADVLRKNNIIDFF